MTEDKISMTARLTAVAMCRAALHHDDETLTVLLPADDTLEARDIARASAELAGLLAGTLQKRGSNIERTLDWLTGYYGAASRRELRALPRDETT